MASQFTLVQRGLNVIVIVVLLIVILPLVLVALPLYFLAGVLLHVAAWCFWCLRGRDVLLVYSNSPVWQSYVEEQLLPRLGRRAIVLNWSHRRTWRRTLSVLVFRFFGGSRNYNPMAIVFRPFRLAKSFRFYEAFREFKHGKREAVTKLTEQLFAVLDDSNGRMA